MPDSPSQWQLKPLHDDGSLAEVIDVGEDPITIGRDPSSTVVIPSDDNPGVSAHHARVILRDDGLWVEDLDSKNGTLVAAEPIRLHRLGHGDVIQLGSGGPRFAVVSSSGIGETAVLIRDKVLSPKANLGQTTIRMVRSRLGIPEAGVDEAIRKGTLRERRKVSLVAALLVVAIAVMMWRIDWSGKTAMADLKDDVFSLQERLAGAAERLDTYQRESDEEWSRREALLVSDRNRLEAQREELEGKVKRLEEGDQEARGELGSLHDQLAKTNELLELHDPVNLRLAKLEEVRRVVRSTVMIEARQTLREEKTGSLLRLTDDPLQPYSFEAGELAVKEANGSGFCLTEEGWIITNAHVAQKKPATTAYTMGGLVLVPEVDLAVVFSGESERHAAKLVKWVADGDQDLALLKIEPFEDMNYLEPPDFEHELPDRAAEVFLIGFPLGKRAMQEGDMVEASAFRGIVSRLVGPYLQVDAAVHPGASGGPVIDDAGHIIGVVVGMQPIDDERGSFNMGYTIPIDKLREIWPPPDP